MMRKNTIRALAQGGFTLIETLVAITILSVAIVAPMQLAQQSLASAYYSRDQITAANLAQEAIEAVRAVRDGNILLIAQGTPTDILNGIPIGSPFTVDTHTVPIALASCGGPCPPLQTNGVLYGYAGNWTTTLFTRTVIANYVGTSHDEISIAVTVAWQTGAYRSRSFTISENLYRWVNDGISGT